MDGNLTHIIYCFKFPQTYNESKLLKKTIKDQPNFIFEMTSICATFTASNNLSVL